MSSYVTSEFRIEQKRLDDIVQRCHDKLQQEIENQYKFNSKIQAARELKKKIERDYELQQKKFAIENQHQEQMGKVKRRMAEKEVFRILDTITAMISSFETVYHVVRSDMRKKISYLAERIHTDQIDVLLKDADFLLQEEKKREEEIRRKLEMETEIESGKRKISSEKWDSYERIQFVSLKDLKKEELQEEIKPWKRFEMMLEMAMDLADVETLEELEVMQKEFTECVPGKKNYFSSRNQAKLNHIIERQSENRKYEERRNEETAKLVEKYLGFCSLLNLEPSEQILDLSGQGEKLEELQKVYDNMWLYYQKKSQREYVEQAFSEVFSRHHIEFQKSFHYSELAETDMQFQINESAQLYIRHNENGKVAFRFGAVSVGTELSLDEKRTVLDVAVKTCGYITDALEELKNEYGICFKEVLREEPEIESIELFEGEQFEYARIEQAVRYLNGEE